ncbi:MAG: AI-2E family transporter [Polaromonas sp.]|jgi:predicted PurR-regulated permease PerM|uniref:AI-2E family transporter n=1 Tax=Polaromonas sp. TaxID=1869339 RepID=UPI002730161B|nr:AI-2E family transporter [Polaromonas sp.]MDP2255610.1 AI-2E family transporter [Polaromonas sp.]MDP3707499.1 AI-2E family transporter [Polaromonas sp.]
MQFTSTQKRTATWCLIAALVVLALWFLGPVLTPFVVAAVLAYVLTPVVDKLDGLGKGRLPRVLAVLLVEALFILALLSMMLLVVPIFAKELPLLREQLPLLAARLNDSLGPWLAQFGITLSLDVESIKTFVLKYLNANFEEAFGSVISSLKLGGSVALTIVGNVMLIPVALFFLLNDWDRFVARAVELVPPKMRASFDSFTEEADSVLGQYLRGQLLVMGVLAIYFSVALALFGFDLAVPVGVFTGLAFFIPYLGFGLGLILAFLAGILQFGSLYAVLVVAGVYGAGQLVESFYLTPRLVGERIGLHPLAVIFALLAFGQLFGFLGVLIALPASAVLLVGIRRVRDSYLASKLYQG